MSAGHPPFFETATAIDPSPEGTETGLHAPEHFPCIGFLINLAIDLSLII